MTEALYRKLWTVVCIALTLLMSLQVMIYFTYGSIFIGGLPAMVKQTEQKPFVYRQLVPIMTSGIMTLTPEETQKTITDAVSSSAAFKSLLRHYPYRTPPIIKDNLFMFLTGMTIDYLFLLGYAWLLWVAGREIFPQHFAVRLLAPLLGLVVLPTFCRYFAYLYDFPALFFSLLLTLLIFSREWWVYLLALVVATVNKETSIYAVALFFLYAWKHMPVRYYLMLGSVQLLIWAGVKHMLNQLYRGNAGQMLQYRWGDNIFATPLPLPMLATLGVVAALCCYRWTEKPGILKCWLILFAPMLLAYKMYGMSGEYRVFYEIFPAIALLVSHSVVTGLRWGEEKPETSRV